jgi:hypothetical protein
MPDIDKECKRRRQQHAERLAESAPLMAKNIPLGVPPVADRIEVNNYYRARHARGEYGKYWPLHHIQTPKW